MGSFKLKNGMRLNTYGEYNADGKKVPNPAAMPWEKNNFKGAFEMKSSDGNFGIRIEVQQGRRLSLYSCPSRAWASWAMAALTTGL